MAPAESTDQPFTNIEFSFDDLNIVGTYGEQVKIKANLLISESHSNELYLDSCALIMTRELLKEALDVWLDSKFDGKPLTYGIVTVEDWVELPECGRAYSEELTDTVENVDDTPLSFQCVRTFKVNSLRLGGNLNEAGARQSSKQAGS